MEDLALQVALVDDVEVDEADAADAGRGQVERGGRAEPAGADQQHAAGLQPALPVDPDLGHDQVARVAGDLLARQLGGHQAFLQRQRNLGERQRATRQRTRR